MINLQKNQGINLSKDHAHVRRFLVDTKWDVNAAAQSRLDQFEVNVSAFLLNHKTGKPLAARDEDFVFYNNRQDPTGAVVHRPDDWQDGDDAMTLDLDILAAQNPGVDEVSLIVEIYEGLKRRQNFGHINHTTAVINDADTKTPIAQFRLTEDDATYTAVQMGSFVRENGDWHFKAIGTGYNKGLAAFLSAYGLQAADEE
ncbi:MULTISPECIES: TerD family protein [Paraburkholderia]|uniref:Tellurium resistance protein TerD n=1 Tax=Paraburkholderia megapolitana TaxID=420953 RepID=A0A1I3D9Z7_9BURK|nr:MULTISPECIES: TerD family protein [Paraburkholderia]MCX4161759.1 TerD family protein [Paraburkholderia megapolitana]MDN7157256.1 TerD family protein [Paraburkholderia sp. CHISQ3]MDQ6494301.1 TerD family protein [Paraburkholderia megapolitana]SFH83574.1 tellurium resistance protein TerD [Paraburkholderia megapolitana]